MKTYTTSILYGSDPLLLEFITIDDDRLIYKNGQVHLVSHQMKLLF